MTWARQACVISCDMERMVTKATSWRGFDGCSTHDWVVCAARLGGGWESSLVACWERSWREGQEEGEVLMSWSNIWKAWFYLSLMRVSCQSIAERE